MKKHTCLLMMMLITSTLLTIDNLSAQPLEAKKQEAYALGISMGFASYQISVAVQADKIKKDWAIGMALDSLANAKQFVSSINSAKNILDTEALDDTSIKALKANDNWPTFILRKYNEILAIRENYTAVLSKNSANLTNAYVLGVNIAIAEGHAQALTNAYVLGANHAIAEGHAQGGEVGRQTISISLNIAKSKAESLSLDLTLLNECITLTNGTAPMSEIYSKLISLRSTYQALL